jgi:hypothetical protein
MFKENNMKTRRNFIYLICAAILLSCGAGPLAAEASSVSDSAQAQRFAKLKKSDPNVSLGLLPVQLSARFQRRHPEVTSRMVANVLGLVCESYGMSNLDALEAEFIPPSGASWEGVPGHLSEFLKKNPPKSRYVLYAQYLTDANNRPIEVRFMVTDAAGNLVLVDRQTKKDEDFKRTAAADPDPMGCSDLVADRLFARLGWQKVEGEPHGKFARKWAQASGMPSDEEKTVMEKSFNKFKTDIKTSQIAVYSTCVNEGHSSASAAHLASLITGQFGCKTMKVDKDISFQLKPTSNEQKLLWDLARAFRDYLRANPADSDYALLAEYFINPGGGPVGAVHFVVCEKSGAWVIVDFQNNQHADFQRVAPKSIQDCDRLTVERLAKRIK